MVFEKDVLEFERIGVADRNEADAVTESLDDGSVEYGDAIAIPFEESRALDFIEHEAWSPDDFDGFGPVFEMTAYPTIPREGVGSAEIRRGTHRQVNEVFESLATCCRP